MQQLENLVDAQSQTIKNNKGNYRTYKKKTSFYRKGTRNCTRTAFSKNLEKKKGNLQKKEASLKAKEEKLNKEKDVIDTAKIIRFLTLAAYVVFVLYQYL